MSNSLTHYGVLGMKWGKRKASASTSSSSKSKSSLPNSNDHKEAVAIQKKKPSQMTNAELRKVNERIRLENEYKRLNPTTLSKGLSFVNSLTSTANTAMNLYGTSKKAVEIGKKYTKK